MNQDIIKNLTSILGQFKHDKSTFEVFKDVVEICSISQHQEIFHLGVLPENDDYKALEKRYLEIIKKYQKPDIDLIVRFYAKLKIFFLNNYDDVLGVLYMSLDLGNKKSGQFFTPYSVSKMMAQMQSLGIEQAIARQGYFTASDPCVGAGGMIIAVSDVVNEKKIDLSKMIFQAIDIDKLCFDMCYVQLSMLGLNGVVIWGDSLALESYEVRKTPSLIASYHKTQCQNVKHLIERMEVINPIQNMESEELNQKEEEIQHTKVFKQLSLF